MCRLRLAEQSIRPHGRQYRRLRARPTKRDHHVCDSGKRGSLFCAESEQTPTWHRAFGLTFRYRRGGSTILCVVQLCVCLDEHLKDQLGGCNKVYSQVSFTRQSLGSLSMASMRSYR